MDLTSGFTLGEWQVLPLEGRILRAKDGESIRVRPKAMDVLCALAASERKVVERDDLLTTVWGRGAVSDEPLTSTIGELRRLLGERQGQERRYIETIPKRGYRLLVEVVPLGIDATQPGANPQTSEQTAPPADAVSVGAIRLDEVTREQLVHARRTPRVQLDRNTLIALALILALIGFIAQRFSEPPGPAQLAVPENSIAVLPFRRLSSQTSQEFFADGLAEELIALLTKLPPLTVAARNSAFSMRDEALSVSEIARRLKVAHILTGSVQQVGDQVRVTAQLVDGRTGYQLWSATYDRTLEDIFAIQDDIASEVQAELQLQLLGNELNSRQTDTRAYTLYLQARHVGRQHTKVSLQQSVELYQAALAIDPEYLPAWNGLAGAYLNQVGFAFIPSQEGYRLASEAAYKALAIDANYAPAHGRLGWIAMHANSNIAAAAEHYSRAMLLEPTNDTILSGAAPVALALGRMDDAIALFEGSVTNDPVSPASHANLANAYLLADRYSDAEQSIRNALTLSPNFTAARYRLGRTLLAQGELAAAREAMEAESVDAARWVGQALVANSTGNIVESDSALARVEHRYGNAAAGNLAQVYAHRADIERAFHWLEVEFTTSGAGSFVEYRWDPLFEPLHHDPRWPALMERVGLSDAALGGIAFPAIAERQPISVSAPQN